MKRVAILFFVLLLLVIAGISVSQQTPSQIVSSGSAFYALNSRDLEVAKSTLLSLIAYGAVASPSSITSNGAEFYRLDYQGHQVAQTYLLSLIASGGSGTFNAASLTNWPNTTLTNATMRFTANRTNFMVTGTEYWVFNDNLPIFSVSAAGAYVFYNGVIGDGGGLTNLTLTPWNSDINGAGKTLSNAGAVVVTNALGLVTSNNAYIGGNLTIIGDIGTVQNISVNGTATFTSGFYAAGNSNYVDGTTYVQKAILATNGIASFSTLAAASIAATGWTNIWATNNATVYVTATAVAWTIKNRANSTIYTSPVLTATVPVHLQPGWSVNAASGLAGTALPD